MGVFSQTRCLLFSAWAILTAAGAVHAAEGAMSRYLPGSIASAIDMTIPEEGFDIRISQYQYEGQLKDRQLQVPIAGLTATGLEVDSEQLAVSLLWNPGWESAGGWRYAMGATFPYVSLEVKANIVDNPFDESRQQRVVVDKASGVGDLVLQPLMLSKAITRNWYSDLRFSVFVPTGSYETGQLANSGKNYWTFSPVVSLINIEPALGREFSLFGGIDINTQNADTRYHSGIQGYIESTFVQYVILLGGFTGVGVSGYWNQQLTGDSGSGASQGDFKSKSAGIGPVLSYRARWSGIEWMAELKWLSEFAAQRYPRGDSLYFKLTARY